MLTALKCFNYLIIGLTGILTTNAITRQQFEQSLAMMRNGCAPKFKLTTEQLDGLRVGNFDANNKDLKCYTKCIAQLAGTLTKKGELSAQKALAQIPMILPTEMQEIAIASLEHCKDVQKNYKDPCDRMFFITKCVYEFAPDEFTFP
ncbi:lush [Glossina fuscipes fuscipes]